MNFSKLGFVRHGSVSSGCPEFPDNHIFIQLVLIEDVADMCGNSLFTLTEEVSHMSWVNLTVSSSDGHLF